MTWQPTLDTALPKRESRSQEAIRLLLAAGTAPEALFRPK
jgi:hypothetical protein